MSKTPFTAAESDATTILLDLLKQAAAAHGIHEAQDLGGVYDKDWPQWYAEHMARKLAELGFTISRVEGG